MLPALTREDLTEALAYVARTVDAPAATQADGTPRGEQPSPGAGLPKAGPGPLTGAVSPAPTRKVTPMSAEEPGTAAEPVPSVAANLHRLGPPAVELDTDAQGNEPELEESIELFHPAYPDKPTVTVSPEGLFDRRWGTPVIAWPDIEGIERFSGRKNLSVKLRHPERYLAAMPLVKRLSTQFKLAFDIPAFFLDTSSLAIRTKDLYYMATRLWHAHRGNIHFRHKHRVKIGKSSRESAWEKCLPR